MGGAFDMQGAKWQSPGPFQTGGTRMAKPELGLKRICVSCGTRFYDLARAPAVCPKCGTEQPAEQPKLKRAPAPVDDRLKKRAVVPEAEGEDLPEADADEADEAIEDADELEDADETLSDEIEVETDREEET
jgi:uncharacterized protein (TIGR02300 family)